MINAMEYTPKNEIQARIKKFQDNMSSIECSGAIIIQHSDFFYLTGTSQSGFLFIPKEGDPVLMIRRSYERAKKESPLEHIVQLNSIKKIPEILEKAGYSDLKILGFELDVLPYNTCFFYKKIFNDAKLIDISPIIKTIRRIKSPYEIGLLSKACSVIDEVFLDVPGMIHEEMPEIELASLFEAGMRKRGYGGCCKMRAFNQDFFLGNVLSGESGAVPTYFDGPTGGPGLTPANNPHGAGWKSVKRNEIIFIDYTCVINGYTADETRMFIIGTPTEKLKEAFEKALFIQSELVALAKPGVACEELYEKAISLAEKTGFGDSFMGIGTDKVKFIGHGVGLELDEAPIFARGVKMPLESGMTFALEPKFVFPEGAIGTENTFVMREEGAEVLTHAKEILMQL